MSSLRRIVAQRRSAAAADPHNAPPEPYPYVIWWTCLIDICALLSGRGDGALVADLARDNAVPTASDLRYCASFLGPPAAVGTMWLWGGADEADEIPDDVVELGDAAWQLHCKTTLDTAKVASVARGMRETARAQEGGVHPEQAHGWAGQAEALRGMVARDWSALVSSGGPAERLAAVAGDEQLGGMVRDVLDHVSLTSRSPKPLSAFALARWDWKSCRRS